MLLKKIYSSSPQYRFVEDLFVSSFPSSERRPLSSQRLNLAPSGPVECFVAVGEELSSSSSGIVDQSAFCGFITCWRFSGFVYVEHFAVCASMRGRGFGSRILSLFCRMVGCPVALEVEAPGSSTEADRRIAFYLRGGFCLLPQEYLQPVYPGRSGSPLPMRIMLFLNNGSGSGSADSGPSLSFGTIRQTLYRAVYGVEG